MIAIKQLTKYTIPPVMDKTLEEAFKQAMELEFKKKDLQPLSLFRTFLDVSDTKLHYLQLNQSQTTLMRQVWGFVYAECDLPPRSVYKLLNSLRNIIRRVFTEFGAEPPMFPSLSNAKVSSDVEKCIEEYQQLSIDPERLRYYEGWTVVLKGGETQFINLSNFYLNYGEEVTSRLVLFAKSYFCKRHYKTAQTEMSGLVSILGTIIFLCPTLKQLKSSGSSACIDEFILQLFMAQKIRVEINKKSIRAFYYYGWPIQLRMIVELFIKSGIWSHCSFPYFNPKFKSSSTHANTHKKIDDLGNAFNDKLVTHVPLSYSDDNAIKALLQSIEQDIEFVSKICRSETNAIMHRLANRKLLAVKGCVRRLNFKNNQWFPASRNDLDIDMSLPANKCANWEHYKWDYPGADIHTFLGNDSGNFIRDFGLLTAHVLTPFLYLLIKEHPEITSGWLTSFELHDKNGKRKGITQCGQTWKAVSLKQRRGNKLAQQTISLNSTSIKLFESIIDLTADARAWMKAQGNDDWRFLLLSCAIGLSKPKRKKHIEPLKSPHVTKSPFGQALLTSENALNQPRTKAIFNNLNLASFRASCGVLVYLKTRSVKAMSDALGHDKYNPKLLSSYLPDPILRYFQGRWVRIFQNALVYEAMKGSNKLFEAMDINEEELDEFLRNHGLKPLPEHIVTGQISDLIDEAKTTENQPSMDAVIPISIPLLRVINAVVELVECAPEKQPFTSFTAQWYETSKFVRECIAIKQCSEEVVIAMAEAELTPLPKDNIKGAVYAA